MNIATGITFKIACHRTPDGYSIGQMVDLSEYITGGSRSFDMGFGGWAIQLNLPENNVPIRKILEVNVRDGDWIEYTITDKDGNVTTLKGFVSQVRKLSAINKRTRSKNQTYSVVGTGWARIMTTPVIIGTAMRGKKTPAVERQSTEVRDIDGTPQLPGIITVDRWTKIWTSVITNAYSGNGLAKALKNLVQILLDDTWKNPQGESFVDLLSWKRFGKPPIEGIAWRMVQMVGAGKSVTPDSILRQASTEAYNEVFYDYDDAGNPAIVFRPRYRAQYRQATNTAKIPDEAVVAIDTTRSGSERYNYWRPAWAMQSSGGIEFTINQANGQSPIYDRDSVERYGLRPVMPQNDLIPPLKSRTNILEYHIGKIQEFRGWYLKNPEFITGSIELEGIYPGRYRVGACCEVPESYWIQYTQTNGEYRYIQEKSFVGYIVDVTESFTVDSKRAVTANTTITFIRGDSKFNQAPVIPDPIPWTSDEPESQPESQPLAPEYVTTHIKWSDLKSRAEPLGGVPAIDVPRGGTIESNVIKLCNNIEVILAEYPGATLQIVSCYRSPALNNYLYQQDPKGVAKTSYHMYGMAMDLNISGVTPAQLHAKIGELMAAGKIATGGNGLYSTGFVHYDIRGTIPANNWNDKRH